MPWSDVFVLGIDSIDTQHRWLVEATNRLHDQIESQELEYGVVREILEGLADYTMNHFILEEELFARLNYPESDTHIEEHNAFTHKTIDLLLCFERGEEAVDEDILEFLQAWLVHHILQVDKAYVSFLKANGVN
jgi:hemerythrin